MMFKAMLTVAVIFIGVTFVNACMYAEVEDNHGTVYLVATIVIEAFMMMAIVNNVWFS